MSSAVTFGTSNTASFGRRYSTNDVMPDITGIRTVVRSELWLTRIDEAAVSDGSDSSARLL